MGSQGTTRQAGRVAEAERLQWSHDRMMEALRRSMRNPGERALVTAAFARFEEYDELLAITASKAEVSRREAIARSRRAASASGERARRAITESKNETSENDQ